jgi:hypothetical protein
MKFLKAMAPQAGKKHTHLVYVNEETGTYEVAEANGHRHAVLLNADGTFLLEPDPVDGHYHEQLAEVKNQFPKRPEGADDDKVVTRVFKLAQAAWEAEKDSIKKAKESDKFHKGDQWGDLKDRLEKQGRAALTINMIQKYVDDLSGYQRQQRTDLKCLPVGETDQILCDIANVMIKVILDQNKFEFVENECFEDQVIAGRGFMGLSVSQANDIRGDIRVEKWPFENVIMGPHLKVDAEDCEYIVKGQKWSVEKLKAKYKDLADNIGIAYNTLEGELAEQISKGQQHAGDEYSTGPNNNSLLFMGNSLIYDKARKEILVLELEEKIYIPVTVIYDAQSDTAQSVFGWKPADIKQILTIPNLYVVEQEVQKMRITRVAGKVLLSDEYVAELPVDDFTIIPVYAKKRGADFWGKVETAKDPQRELNKRISQSIDIVNFSSLYGFTYDEGTFASPSDEKKWREEANSPGFMLKTSDSARPPNLVQGIKFPSEVMGLADASEVRLEKLISVEATRFAGANTSANAILQARESALVGNEFLFRNLKLAKKKLGELLIKYIQKYYSAQRIFNILNEQNNKEEIQIGGQPFGSYSPEQIMEFLKDQDMTKVDITVDETSWSPTQRMAILSTMQDLLQKGAPIPFEMMLPLMDLPESYKQQAIQAIMQQQQAQAQAASSSQESEIQKSLIGQGYFPPKVLEAQGLGPDGRPLPPQGGMPQGPLPPGAQGGEQQMPIDPMLLQGGVA